MDLAITHTHTYNCWHTIWMLLLEKDPGDPQIDCLQTIHLYEADYNLLLKWVASQGFILRSKKAQCITNNQGSKHPGRSTIRSSRNTLPSNNHCGQWCHSLLWSNDWISKQPSMSATQCRPQIHIHPHTNTTRTDMPLKAQIWNLHQLQHQHSWHTLVWNGSRHQQREQQMGNWHRQHVKCVHRVITWLDNQSPQPSL